jgi:hypothetical protein
MFKRAVGTEDTAKSKTVQKWAHVQLGLDRDIQKAVQEEEDEGGNYSDSEGDEQEEVKKPQRKKNKRKKNRNDSYSARIYQMKSANSADWK